MSEFDWSSEKNEALKRIRKASFAEVLAHIRNGRVLDVIRHPNRNRYLGQNIIVLDVHGYVWLVPYVKRKGIRFLKTIIPSRKATREYLS
uniref:Uncharacterized protein n=1 Tax=Candidatus Kentrum sp. LPFa TaxID=2126335 RepID=A0A450XDK0_9GAMM|nr:MAG: hypothetical protein BECKLPF1236A_GA0070988_100481 [Candidatus Kentron sp. LPFa]VFK27373.1 MAG: hypothetical protein BECKLPF1236C_GA0070990_100461 [Candidatus Kentron sp. LPFa]